MTAKSSPKSLFSVKRSSSFPAALEQLWWELGLLQQRFPVDEWLLCCEAGWARRSPTDRGQQHGSCCPTAGRTAQLWRSARPAHARTAEEHSPAVNKQVCQGPWACPRPGWKGLGAPWCPCPAWCRLQCQPGSAPELSQPRFLRLWLQPAAPAAASHSFTLTIKDVSHCAFPAAWVSSFVSRRCRCDPRALRVTALPTTSRRSPKVAAFSYGKTRIPFFLVTVRAESERGGDSKGSPVSSSPQPGLGSAHAGSSISLWTRNPTFLSTAC